jgi:hypothetical protein
MRSVGQAAIEHGARHGCENGAARWREPAMVQTRLKQSKAAAHRDQSHRGTNAELEKASSLHAGPGHESRRVLHHSQDDL